MNSSHRDNPLINIAKDFMVSRDDQRDKRLEEPVYVQQLEVIEAEEDDILEAIKDKHQAEKCRQGWYDEGLVRQGDLDDYEEKLMTLHKSVSKRSGHDKLKDDESKIQFGNDTLNQCITGSLALPLNEWVPQGPYNKGNLHALADRRQLGWHPDWSQIFAKEEVVAT